MKRKRYTYEQIAYALRQAEGRARRSSKCVGSWASASRRCTHGAASSQGWVWSNCENYDSPSRLPAPAAPCDRADRGIPVSRKRWTIVLIFPLSLAEAADHPETPTLDSSP